MQLHVIEVSKYSAPVEATVIMEMEICKEASWFCPRKGMTILVRVCGNDRDAVCKEFDAAVAEAQEGCPPELGAAPSPFDGPGSNR